MRKKPIPPDWLTIPTEATLRKYGLDKQDYLAIAERQGYSCPICGNPLARRTNIEHEHVKGWKDFPAHLRKLFVRGLTCWVCNHYYLGRGITLEKARNVVRYLEEYEKRKSR